MKLKTFMAVTGALCLSLSTAVAQDNPVAKRQQMMKQIGGSLATLSGIAKGDKPFDEAAVRAAVTTVSTNIKAFPDQFPEGSAANSAAAPAIWEKNADFRAQSAKLAKDADTILASMPTDQAGVQKAMQTLGADCGTCHQTYRLKK